MKNNYEMTQNNFEKKDIASLYKEKLDDFIKANQFKIYNSDKERGVCSENVSDQAGFDFQINPENPENAKLIEDPKFLNSFFESKDYAIAKPKSIISREGTTLFISAGVQVLDNVIYEEKVIPEKKLFVAQPVFRTQYMDQVGEGFSTSFINLATEIINPSIDDHFNSMNDWVFLFEKLGFKKNNFSVKSRKKEPQWGDKKFKELVLNFYYDGLEIGDANYLYDVPQKTRDSLKMSDIGFGLERIKWILKGGSYFDDSEIENLFAIDYCKTIALLSGSGLNPSNKEHGYRLRQMSKALMGINKKYEEFVPLLRYYYNYWKKWTYLTMPESGVLGTMNRENERNAKTINS